MANFGIKMTTLSTYIQDIYLTLTSCTVQATEWQYLYCANFVYTSMCNMIVYTWYGVYIIIYTIYDVTESTKQKANGITKAK